MVDRDFLIGSTIFVLMLIAVSVILWSSITTWAGV